MTNNKGSVLVVDDNPTNLSILIDYLEETGLKTFAAEDGESALELLEYIEPDFPDIILLDVMMPGIDGFETCRRLKKRPKIKDIPIIFMTALIACQGPLAKTTAKGGLTSSGARPLLG